MKPDKNTKKIIYEAFKSSDNFIVDLENSFNKNRLGLYDSQEEETVYRFY